MNDMRNKEGGALQTETRGPDAFLKKHWQILVNVYLFLNIAAWVVWRLHKTWTEGNLGYVEIAFAIQNVVFLTVILIRRSHQSIDRNVFNQFIAIVAFFSGLAFIGQSPTGGQTALAISKGIIVCALILSTLCLATLGRSFGILIALRRVQTGGIYGIVRHPMYAADILLRIGYIVGHFNWLTSTLFVLSSACYVYRAFLEERFLSRTPEYQDYMRRVKYRFVPFVF
jgi:protein-S-isoprenylcysteine O-methyltransferase Ste14